MVDIRGLHTTVSVNMEPHQTSYGISASAPYMGLLRRVIPDSAANSSDLPICSALLMHP